MLGTGIIDFSFDCYCRGIEAKLLFIREILHTLENVTIKIAMRTITLDKLLVGKTIKKIYPRKDGEYDREEYEVDASDIRNDSGGIIIEFDDGTKIDVWNSEWGGINLL